MIQQTGTPQVCSLHRALCTQIPMIKTLHLTNLFPHKVGKEITLKLASVSFLEMGS